MVEGKDLDLYIVRPDNWKSRGPKESRELDEIKTIGRAHVMLQMSCRDNHTFCREVRYTQSVETSYRRGVTV